MTKNEILRRFPNASASTLARNNPVGGLPDTQPEQRTSRPLVEQKEKPNCGEAGPCFRVEIISLRTGRLDDDNLRGGAKALRDAIADMLQCDDNEDFIEWEYGQMKSATTGTIVRIQQL